MAVELTDSAKQTKREAQSRGEFNPRQEITVSEAKNVVKKSVIKDVEDNKSAAEKARDLARKAIR